MKVLFPREADNLYLLPILKGLGTYIPGLHKIASKGTGGTISARYCYSVWLRHLVLAQKHGLSIQPEVVAELGPGDSLGIGLAALLSGADRYYALDIVKHALADKNMEIFDELAELFKRREMIPGEDEFPRIKPYLDSYEFPDHILTEERLEGALRPSRIEAIRKALLDRKNRCCCGTQIAYFAPWYAADIIKEGSVDMVYSQAVLEHVDDLLGTYKALYSWLRDGGFMSHQIDFKDHGTAGEWNGHWTYSDAIWRLIRGKRPYLLNRHPHSRHIRFIKECGFDIVYDSKVKSDSRISIGDLSSRFSDISKEDLTTSGAFIQAVKR